MCKLAYLHGTLNQDQSHVSELAVGISPLAQLIVLLAYDEATHIVQLLRVY